MAIFENEDPGYVNLHFKQKRQLFTATIDLSSTPGELVFMNIRRKEGDRIIERLELTGDIERLVRSKYSPKDNWQDISFICDIDLTNIRLAKYEKLEA